MSLPHRPLPIAVWRLLNLLRHRWVADVGVGTCSSASKNKEAILGSISCHDKDLMTVIIDLAGVSSSEIFRRQTPMDDMPGIAELDGILSCATMFFLTVCFQSERCEALQSVAIVGHVFNPMVKSVMVTRG
jgi:hypothetical protein